MAKPIILNLDGFVSSFDIKKVDRKDLYPSKKRIALDQNKDECTRGQITNDGKILKSGMVSSSYFNSDGKMLEKSDLIYIDENGTSIETKPSTLGIEMPVLKKLTPSEALNFQTNSVYLLTPLDLSENLKQSLENNEFIYFEFNYTVSSTRNEALLLKNEHGFFALIGKKVYPEFISEEIKNVSFDESDEEIDDSDELDFDMF